MKSVLIYDNEPIIRAFMRSQGLSEFDAFRRIQKLAMDKQKRMRQIAEAILITEGV